MCLPETRQAYVVLRAFEQAAKPVTNPELREKIGGLLKPFDLEFVEDLGPDRLEKILFKFAKGSATAVDVHGKRFITSEGVALRSAIEPIVLADFPELVDEVEPA